MWVTAWRGALGVVVAMAASGCYCSHERDAPSDAGMPRDAGRARDARMARDAGTARDAGRAGGPAWMPVDATDFEVLYERCETREGQTLVLRVRVVTSACDEPGNVRWDVDRASRVITLRPLVWRPLDVPPCPPSTREIVRDVALRGEPLGAGTWSVVSPDGAALRVEIAPPLPELPCTDCVAPGGECAVDQECMGQRECVPVRGDAICAAVCASSCQPFAETPGVTDIACSRRLGPASCELDPNLGWTCREAAGACGECPVGMACTPSCDWESLVFPGSPCRADGDCEGGLSCVELSGPTGGRACYIRCRGDHPCPLDEACGPGALVCPQWKI